MHIKLNFTIDGVPKQMVIAPEKGKRFVPKEKKIEMYFGKRADGEIKQVYINDEFQYFSKVTNFWKTKEGKRKAYEQRTGKKASYPKRKG